MVQNLERNTEAGDSDNLQIAALREFLYFFMWINGARAGPRNHAFSLDTTNCVVLLTMRNNTPVLSLLLDVDPHSSLTPFHVSVCLHEATW